MPDWSAPSLLLLLPLVPLLRWLHRRRDAEAETRVSAVFLWPDDVSEADARRRRRRVDPRWRRRALACAALVVAAAGPLLVGHAGRRVDVHVDDAPSMRAREPDGPRWDVARRALAAALAAADVADLRVAPLGQPGRALPDPLDAAAWRAAVGAAAGRERRLPAPAELARDREHWLVTDGADPAVVAWARAVPVDRVIAVGAATENAAPTLLAVRPDLRDAGRLAGLVRVTNAGTKATTRRLVVAGAEETLLDEAVDVAPGAAVERTFGVPASAAMLRATLSPPDALPDDDALALDAGSTRPARVRLDPRCGPHLRDAIGAHPGLVRADERPALTVSCSEGPPGTTGPLLRFRRDGAGPPRVALDGGTIDVRADMESPDWVRRPEYPAFVAGLVDRALGRAQLDRTASADLPEAAVRIVAQEPGTEERHPPRPAGRTATDLAGVAIAAAALVLLLDARRSRAGTAARLALLVLLAVALRDPSVPYGRAPLDVVALVDDSLSVDRDAVAERWRQLAAAVRTLPAGGRVTVIRFGADAAVEVNGAPPGADALAGEPPRARPLDRTRTDVERALEDALGRVRRDRPTAIALLTDGAETDGDAARALRSLAAASIPVVAIPVRPAHPEGDAWVESLSAPARARAGDRAGVAIAVGSNGDAEGIVRFRVDGEEVAARTVALRAGATEALGVEVPLRDAGPHVLRAEVQRAGDPRPENDARETLVDVDGPPEALYVTRAAAPPLAASLRDGGWTVATLRPSDLAASFGARVPALVVLDDVGVDDVPGSGWQRLETLVRWEGTGLLVLGGPRSFGAGGYRGSLLEDLLPVTAEGRDPGSRAAILFVVDTSGSMEEDRDGRRRLELARRALVETMQAVPEGDLVGVTSFALEPREILPLARHDDRGRLDLALPAASGGTRMAPALRDAVERLSRADVAQRLLVLLTDGFAPDEDMASVERAIATAGVEVVAVAVGSDVRLEPLERLARSGRGTVLRVDRTAALPRLVGRALGERRAPAEVGSFHPRVVTPLPFETAAGGWPDLGGYMVSRARPGADVYLASDRGDPLLAAGHAGAGRVAVLPGGLGGWAEAWPRWRGWPRFAGGLARWMARPAGNPLVHVRVDDGPRGLAVEVDALGEDHGWSDQRVAHLTVLDPGARALDLDLGPRAPGRYAGSVPALLPGVYRVAARVGDELAVRHALRSADPELVPAASARDGLRAWRDAGLVEAWPEHGVPRALGVPSVPTPIRRALVLIVLAAYLALLAREESAP